MKVFTFILSLVLTAPAIASDENPAKTLLNDMATAVHTRNFDASFVVVKGQAMEPYPGYMQNKVILNLSI